MALRPLILAPDPRLKVKCAPVGAVDAGVRRLMDDMLETMYDAPGIGLSAPQVGETVRVIVADVSRAEEAAAPLSMANPEVVWISEETTVYEEGCLSFPEHYADVRRPDSAKIRYLDQNGAAKEIVASGLLATCLLHEIDHLEGVLFVDHLTALRRGMILRKMQKLKRQTNGAA